MREEREETEGREERRPEKWGNITRREGRVERDCQRRGERLPEESKGREEGRVCRNRGQRRERLPEKIS